jgi:hypothetical protein
LLLALALAATPAAPEGPRAGGGWFDVRTFGAKGDGRTDDSRALQAALDAARDAGGGVVYVPAGTWLVAPPDAGGPKGKPSLRSLTIGSNTVLRGDGPASVLKVKPGVGSYRALLSNHPAPGSPVENVVLSDLRIDQNCAASGGEVRSGGDGGNRFVVWLAWAGRNLTVERVRFDPVCGANTVTLNAIAAQNLVVRDSFFRFVKGPTADPNASYDNTAVYLHGDGAIVTGNVFESTPADGARGAIELHGARGVAANNLTRGYGSCVRVVGTSERRETPPPLGNAFTVTGNACTDAKDAINVWSITGHHVRGVAIVGNTISLAARDHLGAQPRLPYFFGISFVWDAVSGGLDGDVQDVVIEGNVITGPASDGVWTPRSASSGGITLTNAGNISNVIVRGNVLRDIPTKGIHLQAMRRGTKASNVRIEGNVLVDPGHDSAFGALRAGIVLGGVLEDVEVAHNAIVGTRVPFRGLAALRVAASPGSARVGIHDNAWSTADPRGRYRVELTGEGVDAGAEGRTRAVALAPRPGEIVRLEPGGARVLDVAIRGGRGFVLEALAGAVPGERLTVRVRNAGGGPLGDVRWKGVKLGPWTSPAPGHHRVLELLWDGRAWSELFRSPQDVPN